MKFKCPKCRESKVVIKRSFCLLGGDKECEACGVRVRLSIWFLALLILPIVGLIVGPTLIMDKFWVAVFSSFTTILYFRIWNSAIWLVVIRK